MASKWCGPWAGEPGGGWNRRRRMAPRGRLRQIHSGLCRRVTGSREYGSPGLQPGTEYGIRAASEASEAPAAREEGPWRKFRPPYPAAAATRFSVWNDTHQWTDTIRKLHDVTPPSDFLVWNSDTCNNWNQEEWLTPTLSPPRRPGHQCRGTALRRLGQSRRAGQMGGAGGGFRPHPPPGVDPGQCGVSPRPTGGWRPASGARHPDFRHRGC